jgi:hypothetical protein
MADAAAANSVGYEQGLISPLWHFAEKTMLMKQACASVLGTIIGLICVRQAIGENLCRPDLTLNEVEFSAMVPPTLERTWSAVVSVDASACTADSKGYFEIVFTRLSENAPDLEFRQQFIWSAPAFVWQTSPSVGVGLAFGADEDVEQYRIENVSPCVCRN